MKRLILLLILLCISVFHLTAQTGIRKIANRHNFLAQTKWKVNQSPFEYEKIKAYKLTCFDLNNYHDRWGYFIHFDDSAFNSNYSAECRYDCFTTVKGNYWFIEPFTIRIRVLSIHKTGICGNSETLLDEQYTNYLLKKNKGEWLLNKVVLNDAEKPL